jgi:hypothetical protein
MEFLMLSNREDKSSGYKVLSRLSAAGEVVMRPKKWIFLNSIGQALSASVNNAYWLAQAWDIFTANEGENKEEYFIGLSFYAFVAGVSISPIITLGSIYSHYILNTVSTHLDTHQPDKTDEEEMKNDPRSKLSAWQRVLHAFDYISHTSDNAGTPIFIFSMALPNANTQEKIISQCIATFCGAMFAVADSITCYNNIRLYNQIKHRAAAGDIEPQIPEEKPTRNPQLVDTVRQSLVDNAAKPNILLQIKTARQELSLFAKNYRAAHRKITIKIDTPPINDDYQLLPAPP